MKYDVKGYEVTVTTPNGNVAVICIAYNLDVARKFVGVEFYEAVWTLPDSGLQIPSSRQATFKEELRVLRQAASTFEGTRDQDIQHIKQKLGEAYGPDAEMFVKRIAEKPAPSSN